MRPYYQDAWATIYHGDWRDWLPSMDQAAVIVTDQPYGTGWVRGGATVGKFKARHEKPAWDVWDLSWITAAPFPKRIAAFAPVGKQAELEAALPGGALLRYMKTNVRPGGKDYEPIIVSPEPKAGRWERAFYNGDMPLHPCQKPIDVMTWLVDLVSEPSDTIIDHFMGSGTTLRAAKDLRRKSIGGDIDERYCEIAANRLAQEVLAL